MLLLLSISILLIVLIFCYLYSGDFTVKREVPNPDVENISEELVFEQDPLQVCQGWDVACYSLRVIYNKPRGILTLHTLVLISTQPISCYLIIPPRILFNPNPVPLLLVLRSY